MTNIILQTQTTVVMIQSQVQQLHLIHEIHLVHLHLQLGDEIAPGANFSDLQIDVPASASLASAESIRGDSPSVG